MQEITYKTIGLINTSFKTLENIPIQNMGAKGVRGIIRVFDEFSEGLKDLEGFSHLILLYHLHQVKHFKLSVVPFMDNEEHGVFATRSPIRPNPIGLTVVKLIEINKNVITIENVDMLDETPILDIKPCLPMIDDIQNVKLGWLTGKIQIFETIKSDNRFIE